jgi:hypothetical protein
MPSKHPISLSITLATLPLMIRGAISLNAHPGIRESEVHEVSLNAELGNRRQTFAAHCLIEFQFDGRHPNVARQRLDSG